MIVETKEKGGRRRERFSVERRFTARGIRTVV